MLNCEVWFVTIFLWTALMNIWYGFCEKQTSLCFRCDDIYDNETLSLPWYFQYFYHDKHQISLFQMWWYPTSPCMKVMVMTMVIYTMMTVCTMTSGTGGDPSHLFLALDFFPAGWPRSWNTWLRYSIFYLNLNTKYTSYFSFIIWEGVKNIRIGAYNLIAKGLEADVRICELGKNFSNKKGVFWSISLTR